MSAEETTNRSDIARPFFTLLAGIVSLLTSFIIEPIGNRLATIKPVGQFMDWLGDALANAEPSQVLIAFGVVAAVFLVVVLVMNLLGRAIMTLIHSKSLVVSCLLAVFSGVLLTGLTWQMHQYIGEHLSWYVAYATIFVTGVVGPWLVLSGLLPRLPGL